jgi:hypothetical protein
MEKRREIMKRLLRKLWIVCMDSAGLPHIDCNVTFPEMISQDETQKLQNLLLMEQARWIKPERAATMAAKEIGIDNFSYPEEMADIKQQLPAIPMPLTDPGEINPPTSMDPATNGPSSGGLSSGGALGAPKAAGVSSNDRVEAKQNDRTL